jgi:hypothetical protein
MMDQAELPWFAKLNSSLNDQLDKDEFLERIRQSCQQLQQLAYQILAHALSQYPQMNGDKLKACLASFGPEDMDAEAMLPMADKYTASPRLAAPSLEPHSFLLV